MASKLSSTQNARLLSKRISKGNVNEYFNSLSKEDAQNLATAKDEEDFDTMANILLNNLTDYAMPFQTVLQSAYDDEIQMIAGELLKDYVQEIEAEAVDSFRSADVNSIRNLKEMMDIEFSKGLKGRAEEIKIQLDRAIKILSTPEVLQREVRRIIHKKNKEFVDVRTSKVIKRWGRAGKPALVVWGRKGVISLEYLEKSKPKIKPAKLKYIPTKEEWREHPNQIMSRRGNPFTFKERLFVDSRKNKSESQIINDYINSFGNVRTPGEIKKLIGEEK